MLDDGEFVGGCENERLVGSMRDGKEGNGNSGRGYL